MNQSGIKRKRVVLSIADKLEVCKLVKNKVPKSFIMDKFKIGKSTINDICRKEDEFVKFETKKQELGVSSATKRAKVIKAGSFDKLDEALYIWFRQAREAGSPVTGPIMMEKAAELHKLLYSKNKDIKPFTGSSGFQWRFCQRFGIKSLAISGEKLSSDSSAAKKFVEEFKSITEGYSLDQVFNCDETGLYYKMLPGRTLASVHNEPSGTKKAKDRVTINACSNASGSVKLPLLLIGKSKNPRCFRGINKSALGVVYKSQKNAWVNTQIFKDWFDNHFVPAVQKELKALGKEPKAILLMDNCPAHPQEEHLVSADGKITAKFLPPNVTPLIQPMDQGILECIKRNYRKAILRNILSEADCNVVASLKKIDILKVTEQVAAAWDLVGPSTIRKCWKVLFPVQDGQPEKVPDYCDDFVEQFAELNISIGREEIQQWMKSGGPGYEHLNDEGIIEIVLGNDEGLVDDDGDQVEDSDHSICPISNAEAMEIWERGLTWLRFQTEATPSKVATVIQLRELAAEKRESRRKQTSILSFFTPSEEQ